MAYRAVNALANQRVEGRTHGQGQAVAEGKVGQHQTDQAVDRPDMKTPVKEGNLHGLFGRIQGFRCAGRRAGEVGNRLGDAEEQQGDPVAGREQHREPRREAVLRLGVVRSEANVAPTAAGHQHYKQQKTGDGQHIEPAKGGGDVAQRAGEQAAGQRRIADGADHQKQGNDNGRGKDRNQNG